MATKREVLLLWILAFSTFFISNTYIYIFLLLFFAVTVISQTKSDRNSRLFKQPAKYMYKYIALDLSYNS